MTRRRRRHTWTMLIPISASLLLLLSIVHSLSTDLLHATTTRFLCRQQDRARARRRRDRWLLLLSLRDDNSDGGDSDAQKALELQRIQQDTQQQQLEEQRKQIDQLMEIVKQQQSFITTVNTAPGETTSTTTTTKSPPPSNVPAATLTPTTTTTPAPATITPLRVMIFIDGTWLYYSLHERSQRECPILQKFARGWQLRYRVDWERFPDVLCKAVLTDSSYPFQVVRVCVFTSYKPDTSKQSLRYTMFQEMKAANYDVHMFETLGSGEKCVDISLAVEMLHYATVPHAYDLALILTGDKDFVPAMIRTRQKGRQVGLVSMKRGCNRALYETTGVKDYDVVWLEDHLDEIFVEKDVEHHESVVSAFTLTKILYDFIVESGKDRVSSRDVGRYLKFLRIGGSSVSDELKRAYGGLFQFCSMFSDMFVLEMRDDTAFREDKSDRAYWIGLTNDVKGRMLQEVKKTALTREEKEFFDRYTLKPLVKDRVTAYWHTNLIQTAEGQLTKNNDALYREGQETLELPSDLTRDYTSYTVAQLKERCRERGLPVSGVKAVLLERVQNDVKEQIAQFEEEFQRRKGSSSPPTTPGGWPTMIEVPDEVASYLEGLVTEYIHARGGQANSRDVGRYLMANKPSGFDSDSQGTSALAELKSFYKNLASFVMNSKTLVKSDMAPDAEESSFAFSIALKEEGTTANL